MSVLSSSPRMLLPPPFEAFAARAGDIVELTAAMAHNGAGTLLWRDADGVLAFGVVLEPSAPLVTGPADVDLGYFAGVAALCDALAHHGQPERQVKLHWPDQVMYDAGLIGGLRWHLGPLGEDGLPEWVVFAVELTRARADLLDTGLYPNSSSLDEEEFGASEALIESFAAFLKLIVDRWVHNGPETVLRRVLDRVEGKDALVGAEIRDGRLHLPPVADLCDTSAWRDPARGGPKW